MTDSSSSISKFLSFILRHKPDSIGIELDPEGWANIEELIENANIPLNRAMLFEVVATSDKNRFTVSADGQSIRANQGHSVVVNLGLQPKQPPESLYHGTASRFLESIKQQGLKPQNRQYVHLSHSRNTAISVGQRHGKPIVLTIPALAMNQKGHLFFQAKNGVWLTNEVKPEDLQLSSEDSATT
ncbi:RNA 2'-phosphotransferase [Rheinheimera hassiensis]|uniref:RNA 2'-phosphotransferase n=1 Tax=Rheinheimera hassiensis TaxID=1193627 RepID=UPI001F05F3EE|nr:RNA 2'-phosphotransferase [Rheinheimera hassiensis]